MPSIEKTKQKCEKCGGDMVEKIGRYGLFTACSNFPECKNILKEDKKPPVETKEVCNTRLPDGQECGGKMVIRSGRFGNFLACSNYPKCKNTKKIVPASELSSY